MGQSSALVNALKKQLKANGKTYSDVARVLELSEASVKRLFAEESFTLQRLESTLAMIDMDVSDLVEAMQRGRAQVERLTAEQEEKIAKDIELLLVAVSVINGFSFQDLQRYFNLSEHTLVQKLAALDRLKMIDLQPGNRIKLRIAPNFRWLTNGPIQQFFLSHVAEDYFSSCFDTEKEKLLVMNCLCTDTTNQEIQQRMEVFLDDVNELLKKDRAVATHEKYGSTMVLAFRQWQYGLFQRFVRK